MHMGRYPIRQNMETIKSIFFGSQNKIKYTWMLEGVKTHKWTEYLSEPAIAALIVVNKQKVMLMSVYFPHTGYADHHVEKAYKYIEKFTKIQEAHTNRRRRLQRRIGTWNWN